VPALIPVVGSHEGIAGIYDKLLHPGLSRIDYSGPELGCGHDGMDHVPVSGMLAGRSFTQQVFKAAVVPRWDSIPGQRQSSSFSVQSYDLVNPTVGPCARVFASWQCAKQFRTATPCGTHG
jgi:hypothetical protein